MLSKPHVQLLVDGKNHLFGGLTEAQRYELVQNATLASFKPGQTILDPGLVVTCVHLILDGSVRVESPNKLALNLPANQFIGAEVAILSGIISVPHVSRFCYIAKSEVKVLSIPWDVIVGTSLAAEIETLFKSYVLRISTRLRHLSWPDAQALARDITVRVHPAGEPIAEQGQPGSNELLILVSGVMEVRTAPNRTAPAGTATEPSSVLDAVRRCFAGFRCLGAEIQSMSTQAHQQRRGREGGFISHSPAHRNRAGSLASNIKRAKATTLSGGDCFGAEELDGGGYFASSASVRRTVLCLAVPRDAVSLATETSAAALRRCESSLAAAAPTLHLDLSAPTLA